MVLVSVKSWHNHFGWAFWNIHVLMLSSWPGFGSSGRCKTEEECGNSAARKLCSPSLYSCSDFWGELSEWWQEFFGWDAVWHCFLGWSSLLLGLSSSHSPPFFCDLELNCWIGLGHLCHLGLVTTTKGKQAAARPNAFKMLYSCSAEVTYYCSVFLEGQAVNSLFTQRNMWMVLSVNSPRNRCIFQTARPCTKKKRQHNGEPCIRKILCEGKSLQKLPTVWALAWWRGWVASSKKGCRTSCA